MNRNKPDPYSGFKDDRERRSALNTRVRWYSAAAVALAAFGNPDAWMEKVLWLAKLLP